MTVKHSQLPIETELAAALRAAIKQRGLTTAALARRVGVNYKTITSFLNGRDRVSLSRIWQLFYAIGFDLKIDVVENDDWDPDAEPPELVTTRSLIGRNRFTQFDHVDTEEL